MDVPSVRAATEGDLDVVARIMAGGFYDDPVMRWALDNDDTRLRTLTTMFRGLAADMLAPRGVVNLLADASVSLWRTPEFDHVAEHAAEEVRAAADADGPQLFTDEEGARFDNLTSAMRDVHPHEPHWYLNVVSTLPSHQGRGLGGAVITPVLVEADAAGVPCYLESTNPRNRSLYRRLGFEDLGPVPIDGPDVLAMWRPSPP